MTQSVRPAVHEAPHGPAVDAAASRAPSAGELESAALPRDGRRRQIQTADVRGPLARARRAVFLVLIGVWAALPCVRVGGHPALFVDVETHELFLFGSTFNVQDTWLLFFLLTGVGFGLLYATAVAGRVWCGWACPQTVFLEGVFRRIERWVEGSREKRLRRNAGHLTGEKIARKLATHALYALASALVAHVVLGYFVSLPRELRMIRQGPGAHAQAFAFALVLTAVLYFDFAWFREQLCVVLCPYGRLQGALVDEHSLVVGYDARRGEPRGKKGAAGAGDCVDCRRCVVVCPTGIDIRNGSQMECLGCTACIDACNEIMARLGRPPGLVRYDSQNGLAGKPRRFVRPRLLLYTALLAVGAAVAIAATRRHTDDEVALIRLAGEPFTIDGGEVRNALQLHVVNKRARPESYRIDVEPVDGMRVVLPMPVVNVPALGDARVPVFLVVARERFRGDFAVHVRVRPDGASESTSVAGKFLGPAS